MEKTDKKFISDDFLLNYFPSPDKFHELTSSPPKSTLETSKRRYEYFKRNLNQERARSGKSPLSDSELSQIIKNAEGYLVLSNNLKPNKQI